MEVLRVPSSLNDLSGRQLGEKLQEIAAWKAFADVEVGTARAIYGLVSLELSLDARNLDKRKAKVFAQAWMRRVESYSEALKIAYDALSRQVTIRDQRVRVEGSRRYS